jgi:hypothetical protein
MFRTSCRSRFEHRPYDSILVTRAKCFDDVNAPNYGWVFKITVDTGHRALTITLLPHVIRHNAPVDRDCRGSVTAQNELQTMTGNIGAQVEYDSESCAGVLMNSDSANKSSTSCNQQTVHVFRIGERQQLLPLAPPSRYICKSR